MSAFYLVNLFTRLKWALPLYWSVRRFLSTFIVCKWELNKKVIVTWLVCGLFSVMTEMKCRCDHFLKIAEFVSNRGRPLIFVVLYMFDSPLCTFCKREVESIEHLMFHCNVMDTFWEMFCSWLRECEVTLQSFTTMHILCGVFNTGDDFSFPIIWFWQLNCLSVSVN